MTTWFSADFHIGHSRIIEYSQRPFKDVEEMNSEIIIRHNAVIKPEDIVYNLGDFALKDDLIPDVLAQLHGTIHLIAGNHDACFSSHKDYRKQIKKYLDYGFASVQEKMQLKIGNHTVDLCHLPFLKPDDPDQRYSQWRPINKGQFLLHGHCHEAWKVKGRMINVGIDQWGYAPVSESTIPELISDIIEMEQD